MVDKAIPSLDAAVAGIEDGLTSAELLEAGVRRALFAICIGVGQGIAIARV